jgi:hypothetical protein
MEPMAVLNDRVTHGMMRVGHPQPGVILPASVGGFPSVPFGRTLDESSSLEGMAITRGSKRPEKESARQSNIYPQPGYSIPTMSLLGDADVAGRQRRAGLQN